MHDFTYLLDKLNILAQDNLIREMKVSVTAAGPWVEFDNGKRVLQFASNNYLGLANHPDLINSVKSAITKFGVGSSGSRLLSGTNETHVLLEKNLSDFLRKESTLFFSSGYSTNIGVLSALFTFEDAVFSDECNHASIIDGIRLSRATKFIYKHNDMNDLEKIIIANKDKYKKSYLVTDTVFSMDGDLAKLTDISDLCLKYNVIPIVDEAHAIGVFGTDGSGLVSELNLQENFPIIIGTCSKAFGVEGGFCSSNKIVIEYLKNKSRSFIFSTSPTIANIAAVTKSLELVKDGSWRRERLWSNAKRLYEGLKRNHKLTLGPFHSPIIVIRFNDIDTCLNVSRKLFHDCHIWAPAIRPPSVKSPVIRLTPIFAHSEEDINFVIKAFDFISPDIPVEPLSLLS